MPAVTEGNIPRGSVLSDIKKNQWVIKDFIEITGCTEVYTAELQHNDQTSSNYHSSEKNKMGPLSADLQFYIYNANPKDIDHWKEINCLQNYSLGMPRLLGSGRYKHNGVEYNFIVTQQFGSDLRQLFSTNSRQFPEHTVYKVAFQTLHVLEYIHSRGYIHGDIREDNLVLESNSEQHHVYLVNFASTLICSTKRSRFNLGGTIEYISRDHYMGVPTKRGDLESLLYTMISCLTGHLPWVDTCLKDPFQVHQMKKDAFQNVKKFVKDCFHPSEVPAPITEFALEVANTDRPNKCTYLTMQNILCIGLQNLYHTPNGKLQFKIDILVPENKHEAPKLRGKKCIKGLDVSVELLAAIISENCRNLNEVDLHSTKPGDIMDVIHRLTNLPRCNEHKIKILRDAWQNDIDKLKTRVVELWKRKGINVNLAPTKDKDAETNKSLLPAAAANKVTPSFAVEEVRQVGSSAKAIKRKVQDDEDVVSRKRRIESTDKGNGKLDRPNKSDSGADNPSRERSLSLMNSGYRSLIPTLSGSKIIRSSISMASSSGFSNHRSSQSSFGSEQMLEIQSHDKSKYLDVWLGLMEKTVSQISSELQSADTQMQKLLVIRDQYNIHQPRLECLILELSTDLSRAQELNGIMQRWQNQLNWLQEYYQKLNDTCFVQLRNALQDILDELDKLLAKKLLVSSDRNTLQQQLELCEKIHQRVMSRQTEVTELLKKGREYIATSENLESQTKQQGYLDSTQFKWNCLNKRSDEFYARLRTCAEHCEKYYKTHMKFSAWLSETETKLMDMKPTTLKREEDLKEQLERLCLLKDEVCKKSVKLEEYIELGELFISSCDIDKDVVEDELIIIKDRWDILDARLFQHTQLLEDSYKLLVDFKASLSDMKQKLQLYEKELTTCNPLRATKKSSGLRELTEKLLEKTGTLRGPLDILRQRVIHARKQGISVDHLIHEINGVTIRIANLKGELDDNLNEIRKKEQLSEKETPNLFKSLNCSKFLWSNDYSNGCPF